MSLVCQCEGPAGFTNMGHGLTTQWWVHGACGRPTEPWVRAQGEDVLNYFRGGPWDGTAYTTSALLEGSDPERVRWVAAINEYVWTPEVIISEKTGASARVWIHKSLPQNVEVPLHKQAPAPTPAANGTATAATSSQEGATTMAKKTVPPPPSTDNLEDRRKAGGFSRAQVAEAAGITVSKVYRIEKGGARTTEEETAAVTAALASLESANAS